MTTTQDDVEARARELKPCPFCGGAASADGHIRYSKPLTDAWWDEDHTPITEAFYVNCMRCGAVSRSGITGGYRTKQEAIERWNTRSRTTDPGALPADGDVAVTRQGVIDDILREMNRLGISQQILARKMGVSGARVTQLLGEGSNPTLNNVERIWSALLLLGSREGAK